MGPVGPDLSTTGAAVLGLLTFGDASGYELRTRADATLRFFFAAPAMSQIYAELERLGAAGLVSSREMKRPGARPGRVWRLTPKGRRRLARWATEEPVAPTVLRHHLALRLVLGALVAPSRLQEMVDEHVATVVADRDALRAVLDGLDPDDPATAHAMVVAEWGIATYATELAGMARIRERLGELPSPLAAAGGRAAGG